jgi:ABC-type Fe3+/spermidine/putrescine transport system ATPase subunit
MRSRPKRAIFPKEAVTQSSGLTLDKVAIRYGDTTVLRQIDLEVRQGELIALLGSSGCGKTSLLRAVAGFVPLASGRILVGATDITHVPAERRQCAMMFQSYALWPHMSVAQNIAYGLRVRKWTKDKIAARVEDLLRLLQLEGFGPRSVEQLSGGQRQRVAMGRALAIDPALLLLDEPMSNLDYRIRLELRHEIRALQQRLGITTLYVTHDREEALTLADRVVVLNAGEVAQIGTPEEVFHQPASPFVAMFMGADNTLELTPPAGAGAADRSWRLRDGEGPGLDLRAHPRAAALAGAGNIRLHFRSQAAHLAGTRGEFAAGQAIQLRGAVEQTAYLGEHWRSRVRMGAASVWVDTSTPLTVGTPAIVQVPVSALHLFPVST